MFKRFKRVAVLIAAAAAAAVCASVPAAYAAEAVNMLASKGDWVTYTEMSSINISGGKLNLVPVKGEVGATYIGGKAGDASISFDYQMTFAEGVAPYSEDMGSMLPGSFWGIVFLNNFDAQLSNVPANYVQPWMGTGGYQYMLCFDSERQVADPESPRYNQLGLSVRRYKTAGGHDYAARWSTVEPGDFEYITSNARTATSKTPAFNKPVNLSDCFDGQKHSVTLTYNSRYKSNGDSFDGIEINVWFDAELVLTVKDEMPIQGEEWGTVIDIDKRGTQGFVQVYAHNNFAPSPDLWEWELELSALSLTAEDFTPGSTGGDNDVCGCGGGSSAAGLLSALTLLSAAAIIKRR